MRFWPTLAVLLAFSPTPLAVGQGNQLTITVPVIDESSAASPVTTTGTAVFSESVEGGKAICSYDRDSESKNVSQQPVVLLVIEESVRCSNGHGFRRTTEHEYLFEQELLGPGAAMKYPSRHWTSETTAGRSLRSATQVPAARATTLYVQFDDGTSFGDEKYALHVLQIRQGALQALRKLQEIYQTQGERGFLDALRRKSDAREITEASSVEDLFIEPIRKVQAELGTGEAIRQLQERLSNAEGKLANLDVRIHERSQMSR